jgi:hypothetical protein
MGFLLEADLGQLAHKPYAQLESLLVRGNISDFAKQTGNPFPSRELVLDIGRRKTVRRLRVVQLPLDLLEIVRVMELLSAAGQEIVLEPFPQVTGLLVVLVVALDLLCRPPPSPIPSSALDPSHSAC